MVRDHLCSRYARTTPPPVTVPRHVKRAAERIDLRSMGYAPAHGDRGTERCSTSGRTATRMTAPGIRNVPEPVTATCLTEPARRRSHDIGDVIQSHCKCDIAGLHHTVTICDTQPRGCAPTAHEKQSPPPENGTYPRRTEPPTHLPQTSSPSCTKTTHCRTNDTRTASQRTRTDTEEPPHRNTHRQRTDTPRGLARAALYRIAARRRLALPRPCALSRSVSRIRSHITRVRATAPGIRSHEPTLSDSHLRRHAGSSSCPQLARADHDG